MLADWKRVPLQPRGIFNDLATNREANETACVFMRNKTFPRRKRNGTKRAVSDLCTQTLNILAKPSRGSGATM